MIAVKRGAVARIGNLMTQPRGARVLEVKVSLRPRISWINKGPDDAILELLDETDMVLTPKVMAFEIDYDYSYLRQRLGVLKEHGFVTHPSETPSGVTRSGVYEITPLGRRYLRGETTSEELDAVLKADDAT